MQKYHKLFAFIAVLFALVAFAVLQSRTTAPQSLTQEINQCLCHLSKNDPYAHPQKMEYGSLIGMCVNDCKFRAPVKVAETPKSLTIANVLHDGAFWIATLPTDQIEKVDVIFENFAPKLYHTAFHFYFKQPVKMKTQDKGLPSRTFETNEFVLSPEALIPERAEYNLWDGIRGNYPLGMRAYTFDYMLNVIHTKKHPYTERELTLSDTEKAKLIDVAMKFSDEKSFRSVYHLLFNNCATSTVDLALQAKGIFGVPEDPFRGLAVTWPFGTSRSLNRLGLVKKAAAAR